MNCPDNAFFEKSLPVLLLESQEKLAEAEEKLEDATRKLERIDAATTAFQWMLERYPAERCACITPKEVSDMFAAITIFGFTGRKVEALEAAMEALG